ncbi:hypothetical protein ABZT06_47930 [Streptomyces sp. NPDC005483]|uniref:hypothetical protein n=1 Tax=Streptomyces sp. NPDC005483 TaxID=3154882 RepID=UPI0033BC0FE2
MALLLSRTRTSLHRSPLRSPNGTALTEVAQPLPLTFFREGALARALLEHQRAGGVEGEEVAEAVAARVIATHGSGESPGRRQVDAFAGVKENRQQGGIIRTFFGRYHILPGDNFYVQAGA